MKQLTAQKIGNWQQAISKNRNEQKKE